jgi:hypothetical protein
VRRAPNVRYPDWLGFLILIEPCVSAGCLEK